MKELNDIIRAFHAAQREGTRCALATVVKVEGSSYRQPGARMLVTETGLLTGAISGGCLEGDALKRALLAIEQQQNKLVIYDTSNDDDVAFGVQLGCNGIVYILFEPIDYAQPQNPLILLEQLVGKRKNAVIAILFCLNRMEHQPGTKLLVRQEVDIPASGWGEVLATTLLTALETERSLIMQLNKNEQKLEALIEYIAPPVQLIIAGAGNDVQPLVAMASLLGWRCIVADGRKTHATTKRFPQAENVLVLKPGPLAECIIPDRYTMLLLMTHNYNYDLELLKLLASAELPYMGILGPKKKFDRMLSDLAAINIVLTEEQLDRIFTPVGLDIGAETSEEIAISIIAEIKAVLSGRKGFSLKFKEGQIHGNLR